MFGIVSRLKSLLGFGSPTAEQYAEDMVAVEDTEDLPEEVEQELESLFQPSPIEQAVEAHVTELEEAGEDIDDVLLAEEDDEEWEVVTIVDSFETETGTDGRITMPKEIRGEQDIGHKDRVLVEAKFINSSGNEDEIWVGVIDTDMGVDGRFRAPQSFRDALDWEPGINVNCSVYEVVDESSLSEWEDEVEEFEEVDQQPPGFNASASS